MNLLKGCRVYLAGPVEKVDDNSSWREYIRPILGNMGLIVWDPLIKPEWFVQECGCELTAEEQRRDLQLFEDSSKDLFVKPDEVYAAYIRSEVARKTCLRLVSSCDFAICSVGGMTVGTFEELSKMSSQGKPIIFLHNSGKLDSCWRYVQFKNAIHKYSSTEITDYLTKVDNGTQQVDNKQWIFLPGRWPDASSPASRSDKQSRSSV